MHPIAIVAALIAMAIHAYFFLLESVWFMRPVVWSRFGLKSVEHAAIVRSFAFNQGFYNLFLAIGVLVGLSLIATGTRSFGSVNLGLYFSSQIFHGSNYTNLSLEFRIGTGP